jgi:hypothetical protein
MADAGQAETNGAVPGSMLLLQEQKSDEKWRGSYRAAFGRTSVLPVA